MWTASGERQLIQPEVRTPQRANKVLALPLQTRRSLSSTVMSSQAGNDVPASATSFRKYELLPQRWHSWAGLYPGVALLLGAMGMAAVGKAVFVDKMALNFACVGGNAKVPLGLVSFSENLLMALMGAEMITAEHWWLPVVLVFRPLRACGRRSLPSC